MGCPSPSGHKSLGGGREALAPQPQIRGAQAWVGLDHLKPCQSSEATGALGHYLLLGLIQQSGPTRIAQMWEQAQRRIPGYSELPLFRPPLGLAPIAVPL